MNPIAAKLAPDSDSRIVIQTLLLTDLVNSTQLVDRLGDDRAVDVFARHDRLARDLLDNHGGVEIDKTDGFLLLFERPIDALRYALDYHRQLAQLGEELDVELQARAGIHLGELVLRQNPSRDVARGAKPLEVEGLAKPTAARTMALASGGQTLMTRAAFDLCRRRLSELRFDDEMVHWYDHGRFAFKGLEDSVGIFEIALESTPLPRPLQANDKAHRVAQDSDDTRKRRINLLGVVGLLLIMATGSAWLSWSRGTDSETGDSASPRLSVAVLRFQMVSRNQDDDWLGTALADNLSAHLGIDGSLHVIPAERILEAQRDLITTAAASLGSDTLRSLRDRLGADYVVSGSFSTGNDRDDLYLNVFLQDARSGESSASLPLNGEQSEFHELVSSTAQRLRQQLGVSTVTQKQESQLEAVLSDSPQARAAYTRGLEKLRAYDAAGARDDLQRAIDSDPDHALAHLALSQAESVLGYDELAQASGRRAYELAEVQELPREQELLITANYQEQLNDWSDAVETYTLLRNYHKDNIDHGLRLIDILLAADRSTEATGVLEDLLADSSDDFLDPRIDLAQAKIAKEQSVWSLQLSAADRVLERARAQQARSLEAEAHLQRGWALLRLGRPADARLALEQAKNSFESIGDRGRAARCIAELAVLDGRSGELASSERLHREALEIFRGINDIENISRTLNNLAVLKRDQGHLGEALRLLERAASLARTSGNDERLLWAKENTSSVLLLLGRLSEAQRYAEQALELAERMDNSSGRLWALHDLGLAAVSQGDLDAAQSVLTRGLSLAQEGDSQHPQTYLLQVRGWLHYLRDQLPEAEADLERALQLRQELEQGTNLAGPQLLLARVFLVQQRFDEAEALAQQAHMALEQQGRADDLALADALLAQILESQERHDEAARALARAQQRAQITESPQVRIFVRLVAALDAYHGDRLRGLLNQIAQLEQEARRHELEVLRQDISLVHALVELSNGSLHAGQSRLKELTEGPRSELFALNRRLATQHLDRVSAAAGAGSVVQPPPGREVIAP